MQDQPGNLLDVSDAEVLLHTFAEADFADLDSYKLAMALCFFAEAVRDSPLESFEDVNSRIGTANGLASGLVRGCMTELEVRGYLDVSSDGAVCLTSRGIAAAGVVGITVD